MVFQNLFRAKTIPIALVFSGISFERRSWIVDLASMRPRIDSGALLAGAWSPDDLQDKVVLDAGCGAGRFAEIGALVVCIDFFSSVLATQQNLGYKKGVLILQADINNLSLARESFDYVYSLGVLRHTLNPEHSFKALPEFLRPDGRFCVDFYEKSWRSLLHPKYWLRQFTTRMSNKIILQILIPILYPVGRPITTHPMGSKLRKIFPIADPIYFYEDGYGKTNLSYKARLHLSLLDTHDWVTPRHDKSQTRRTVFEWAVDSQLKQIEVENAGHLVVRGVKKP